jgi:hypothetical protein
VFSGCQRQFSTRGPAPKERLWLRQYDTGEVCHPLAACAGALEAWRSWFHSVFEVLPRQSDEAGFLAESRLWNLDGLAVSRVAAPSIHVARTKALIRRNPVDNWAITIGIAFPPPSGPTTSRSKRLTACHSPRALSCTVSWKPRAESHVTSSAGVCWPAMQRYAMRRTWNQSRRSPRNCALPTRRASVAHFGTNSA